MSSLLLQAFNKQLSEFLDDVERVFPNDVDIKAGKNSLLLLKKANPKKIIEVWKTYVTDPYFSKIENNEIEFFINKDYNSDIGLESKSEVISAIDRLRDPIRRMEEDDKQVVMKYLLNLCKLTILYFNN
ncbi:MAG: hypothetical protein ACXABD_00735 [Candidatus Thorarchaeota archaeon]|jgi:hypothetical protein